MWHYNNKEFTSEDIGDYVGFVYIITDLHNGMKYLGKKTFVSKRKLPPLKGKTKRRTKVVESDWKSYYGSSDQVKALVESDGGARFHREIVHLCMTKGELSYMEAKLQFDYEVLLKPEEWYNGIIQCRINRSHVRTLWQKSSNSLMIE